METIKAKIEQNKKDRRLSNGAFDAELARLECELKEEEVTYSIGDRFRFEWLTNRSPDEHILAMIDNKVGMIDVATGENWGGHCRCVDNAERITVREMGDLINSCYHTRYYDARKGQNV